MARNNTEATKPEDEKNAVQQTTGDEQNTAATPQSPQSGDSSPCTGEPETVRLAVISTRGLALREKPGKEHTMLAVLPTGTVLTGREEEEPTEGWIAVQTKDGKEGWVDTRFVTVVD